MDKSVHGLRILSFMFLCFQGNHYVVYLSHENQANIIEALNSTSSYLDVLLNIDNNYFEQMVYKNYLKELSEIKLIYLMPKQRFCSEIYLYILIEFLLKFTTSGATQQKQISLLLLKSLNKTETPIFYL